MVAQEASCCHIAEMKNAAPLALAAPLIAILLLAGCSKERDVAYYKEHPAERGKRTADCDTYSDASQDCLNAKQAQLEAYAVQPKETAPKDTDVAAK